jgi:hypothetical protein
MQLEGPLAVIEKIVGVWTLPRSCRAGPGPLWWWWRRTGHGDSTPQSAATSRWRGSVRRRGHAGCDGRGPILPWLGAVFENTPQALDYCTQTHKMWQDVHLPIITSDGKCCDFSWWYAMILKLKYFSVFWSSLLPPWELEISHKSTYKLMLPSLSLCSSDPTRPPLPCFNSSLKMETACFTETLATTYNAPTATKPKKTPTS